VRDFLEEYWLWILIPFVVVGGIAALLLVSGGGGASMFDYNIF